ncbi:MAG: hypothetical protein RLZZ630_589 [Bacteroidota bacterium]
MTLKRSPFNLAVLAAGLGFFIDAFDLFLFNIYRIPSLKELGLDGQELTRTGEQLLAIQMAGMITGGILTGIIGDKKGRVAVLFGSILLYSLCNIFNAFVQDVESYAVIRFLAGVGLAGELGAGIALVSESMTIEHRGYGTILVASLGAAGAVSAGLIGNIIPWRTAFFIAGCAGLLLLLLRVKSMESAMFKQKVLEPDERRGSFRLLFSNRTRTLTYLACILTGVPIWYSVGLLITLSPEIARLKNIAGLELGTCFILFQTGILLGDLSSGIVSQLLKSRKKVLIGYMCFALVATVVHFGLIYSGVGLNLTSLLMGIGCGYLSVFVTSTAEHFGTNMRVLVTSTVTNFMRGAVTILIPFHIWIESQFDTGLVESLAITGTLVWFAALISVFYLPETFGKNLDYVER